MSHKLMFVGLPWLLTLLLSVVFVNADLGDLDLMFGNDGIITTDIDNEDVATDIIIQPDGKLVVIGGSINSGIITRYNNDGSLDTSFGFTGIVTAALGTSYSFSSGALQSDGKILVAGRSSTGDDTNFAVARFNSNGTLDTTFANAGILTDDVSQGGDDRIWGMAIQTDNKIIVTGKGGGDLIIARYHADGTTDNTFGVNGLVHISSNDGQGSNDLILQSDGKILVTGDQAGIFAVIRLNHDGSFDTTFSDDGIATADFDGKGLEQAFGLTLQSDGKVVAVGISRVETSGFDFDAIIARFNNDGSLDNSFATDGKLAIDFNNGVDQAFDVVQTASGKIVVAAAAPGFKVLQFNSDGTLDNGFADNGIFSGPGNAAHSLLYQPDGKLTITGYANNADFDFLTVRLEGETITPKSQLFLPIVFVPSSDN